MKIVKNSSCKQITFPLLGISLLPGEEKEVSDSHATEMTKHPDFKEVKPIIKKVDTKLTTQTTKKQTPNKQ